MVEKTVVSVRGMTCSSCAEGIGRQLVKKGYEGVSVSFEEGKVELSLKSDQNTADVLRTIDSLGYQSRLANEVKGEKSLDVLWIRFLICSVLTLPLLAHMYFDLELLHHPMLQFFLALPVLIIGMQHFGRSAWGSLKAGEPNMDVLISLGSLSAFAYSMAGWLVGSDGEYNRNFMFFETGATIITLVLLGNLIERRSLFKTREALHDLLSFQTPVARRIENAMTERESLREVKSAELIVNDLIQINSGEVIPADAEIYWGQAWVNEAGMTGESTPVGKMEGDSLLCGTLLTDGVVKAIVRRTGDETVLAGMIDTIRKATLQKPAIQRLGDRISLWFVPVVIGIGLITLLFSYFYLELSLAEAVLRGIAVLVISCPCAMGLATPAAVAVGVGKAARRGILVKGADVLERINEVNCVVFDKTGTLTDAELIVRDEKWYQEEDLCRWLIATLEPYSSHPLAQVLSRQYADSPAPDAVPRFKEIKEEKGLGIFAEDLQGNRFSIGSAKTVGDLHPPAGFNVYVRKNNTLLGAVSLSDQLRPESKELIAWLRSQGIRTVVLSGDQSLRCEQIATEAGVDEWVAEKLPTEKVDWIREKQKTHRVMMIGDGINDGPALSAAWVGVAIGQGSGLAIKSSDAVLMQKNPLRGILPLFDLAKRTFRTIRQNLLWALLYNVVAIPLAAMGFLSPMLASLSMAFSDVVVIGNSLRLRIQGENKADEGR